MTDSLTLAIPFHRNVGYLEEALQSALDQTDPTWQAVVYDDGDGDQGVLDLIDRIADDRIRYFRNDPPLGMVANWNRALDDSTSELITLLHADDRLLPNYVGQMREAARRHPTAVAFHCGAEIIDANGERRISVADAVKRVFAPKGTGDIVLAGESAVSALMSGNFIMCPTLCFRMSLLGDRRFDGRWRQVQDLELTTRLLMEGDEIVGLADAAYAYRRHAGGATAQQSESFLRFDEEVALYDEVERRANSRGWEHARRVASGKRIIALHLLYRAAGQLARLQVSRAGRTIAYVTRRLHRSSEGAAP